MAAVVSINADSMKILLAIDGSDCAQSAIDAVLHQPWPEESELRLISVLSGLETLPFFSRHAHLKLHSGAPVDLDLSEAHSRTEEHLALVAAEISSLRPGITVSAEVRRGEIAEELVNSAVDWSADLVVIGSHGRKGFSRLFLGSVSQTVLLTAPMPVIIVRQFEISPRHEGGFSRVVVALDGSAHSESALNWIARQSWSQAVQFHLVHVYNKESIEYHDTDKVEVGTGAPRGSSLHGLQARAAGLSEVLGLGHDRFSCQVIGGAPAPTIVKVAEEIKADLILLGSHGWQGLARVLLGSVSQQVAENAHCSVGIIPMYDTGDADQDEEEIQLVPEEPKTRADYIERPHVLPGGMI